MTPKRSASDVDNERPEDSDVHKKKPCDEDMPQSLSESAGLPGHTPKDFDPFNEAFPDLAQGDDATREDSTHTANQLWQLLSTELKHSGFDDHYDFSASENTLDLPEKEFLGEETTNKRVEAPDVTVAIPIAAGAPGRLVSEEIRELESQRKHSVPTKVEETEDYFSRRPTDENLQSAKRADHHLKKRPSQRDLTMTSNTQHLKTEAPELPFESTINRSHRLFGHPLQKREQPGYPYSHDAISAEAAYSVGISERTYGEQAKSLDGQNQPSMYPSPVNLNHGLPYEYGQPFGNPNQRRSQPRYQSSGVSNDDELYSNQFYGMGSRIGQMPPDHQYDDEQDATQPQHQLPSIGDPQSSDDGESDNEEPDGWPFQNPKPEGRWPPACPNRPGPGGPGTWPCDWIELPLRRDRHKYSGFPDGTAKVPGRHLLEVYCYWFPNHVWGAGLATFEDQKWGGRRIWDHYHPNAVEECRRNTLKAGKNLSKRPWNFLQKHLSRWRQDEDKKGENAWLQGPGAAEHSEQHQTEVNPQRTSSGPRRRRKSSNAKESREQTSQRQTHYGLADTNRLLPNNIGGGFRLTAGSTHNQRESANMVGERRPQDQPWWQPRLQMHINRTRRLLWQTDPVFSTLPDSEQRQQVGSRIRQQFLEYARRVWWPNQEDPIVLSGDQHPVTALQLIYHYLRQAGHLSHVADDSQYRNEMVKHYLRDLDDRLSKEEMSLLQSVPGGHLSQRHQDGGTSKSSHEAVFDAAGSNTASLQASSTGSTLVAGRVSFEQAIDPQLLDPPQFSRWIPSNASDCDLARLEPDSGAAQFAHVGTTRQIVASQAPGIPVLISAQSVSGNVSTNTVSEGRPQRTSARSAPRPEPSA